ncbi:MAG TPA: hypothetical protein VN153_11805 [Tahibacter sp.]|nr:hypothetical protein [Tahibacter sp.]
MPYRAGSPPSGFVAVENPRIPSMAPAAVADAGDGGGDQRHADATAATAFAALPDSIAVRSYPSSLTSATVLQHAAATLCGICETDSGLRQMPAATSADTAVRAGKAIQ